MWCVSEKMADQSSFEAPEPRRDAEDAQMPSTPGQGKTNSDIVQVLARNQERLLAIEGVAGVGIGRTPMGGSALVIFVLNASVKDRVPKEVEGYPATVVVTGPIEIQPG